MFGPGNPSVSYSGPFTSLPSTVTRLPHLITQEVQPKFFVSSVSASVSPLTSSALSKLPRWKLCVGMVLVVLQRFTNTAVPYDGIISPVEGCSWRILTHFLTSAWNFSGLATDTLALPFAVIALRFLGPITAPAPPRPAARSCEMMQALSLIHISEPTRLGMI